MGRDDPSTVMFLLSFTGLLIVLLASLIIGGLGERRRRRGPAPITDKPDATTRG